MKSIKIKIPSVSWVVDLYIVETIEKAAEDIEKKHKYLTIPNDCYNSVGFAISTTGHSIIIIAEKYCDDVDMLAVIVHELTHVTWDINSRQNLEIEKTDSKEWQCYTLDYLVSQVLDKIDLDKLLLKKRLKQWKKLPKNNSKTGSSKK